MKDYNFSCQNCDEPFTILEVKDIEGLCQRVKKGETITHFSVIVSQEIFVTGIL